MKLFLASHTIYVYDFVATKRISDKPWKSIVEIHRGNPYSLDTTYQNIHTVYTHKYPTFRRLLLVRHGKAPSIIIYSSSKCPLYFT